MGLSNSYLNSSEFDSNLDNGNNRNFITMTNLKDWSITNSGNIVQALRQVT